MTIELKSTRFAKEVDFVGVRRAPRLTDGSALAYAAESYWQYGGSVWRAARVTADLASWENLGIDPTPLVTATGVAAAAAYGVKRLVAGYAGPCLRVVRASDSATLDVGFLSDGWIDAPALFAFLVGTTGKVDIWYDQSGNTRNALQTTDARRPTISATPVGGRFAINFQAAYAALGQYFDMPATVSVDRRDCTVAAIGLPSVDGGLTWDLSANGTMMLYDSGSGNVTSQTVLYTGSALNARSQDSGQSCISVLASGASGYTSSTNDLEATGSAISTATVTTGRIGATNFAVAHKFSATALWQGFIVWGQAFTAAQLKTLRRAAYREFDILPQIRDNIVFPGDSISFGVGAYNQTLQQQMAPLLVKPCNVWNMSEGGRTLDDMTTNIAARLALTKRTGAKNICVVWGGTNNIKNGETAAATYAKLLTLCALVRAAGYICIVLTADPRTDWALDAVRLAYNTLMRDNWATFADAIVDVGADPTTGPNAAASDTALFADGIHRTPLGYAYGAPAVASAVNSFLLAA